ncbi:MAG: hypothetical protein U9O53_02800 [archaeon]|nr:hypothetical protein [archaeon]
MLYIIIEEKKRKKRQAERYPPVIRNQATSDSTSLKLPEAERPFSTELFP